MSDYTNSTAAAPSTKDLKQVLGFGDLMGASVGQIIGAGIMSLMGVAIAMTGRSAMISFIIAAMLVLINTLPSIIVSGTVRMRGGNYTQAALLGGSTFGGVVMLLGFFVNLSLAMYALSFADYFFRFVPGVPVRLVAVIVFTGFWLLNMFGIDKMAKVQNLIVIIMCVALALFAAFGMNKIQPGFFGEGFITNGALGLFQAAALLTFATGGATVLVNLSGEAKNPVRDIPLAMIVSTVLVAILYGILAFVAAGVLPVEQVAGKPLTQVAEAVLPTPLFVFFIVGGAMFALASTLNSQFAAGTKPMLQASVDGWLPRKLAYIHPKFKTPMIWLTIFYGLGLIPIISGLNIGEVANMVVIIGQVMTLVLNVLLIRLPKAVPEIWEKSKYRVGRPVLVFFSVISVFGGGATIMLLITSSTPFLMIGNAVMLGFTFLYCYFRAKSGKVNMEVSYEAQ
ncbi:MAG: APC family permease [Treponema sp.]|jgi:APA family basic amino acid/polyamine antiporter|nr:APC family permease [Treponema sp.]